MFLLQSPCCSKVCWVAGVWQSPLGMAGKIWRWLITSPNMIVQWCLVFLLSGGDRWPVKGGLFAHMTKTKSTCVAENGFDNFFQVPPQNLTWNLKMMVSKRNLLLQGLLFRFHVKFEGCSQKLELQKPVTCLGSNMYRMPVVSMTWGKAILPPKSAV